MEDKKVFNINIDNLIQGDIVIDENFDFSIFKEQNEKAITETILFLLNKI